jgi:hypothetical protein
MTRRTCRATPAPCNQQPLPGGAPQGGQEGCRDAGRPPGCHCPRPRYHQGTLTSRSKIARGPHAGGRGRAARGPRPSESTLSAGRCPAARERQEEQCRCMNGRGAAPHTGRSSGAAAAARASEAHSDPASTPTDALPRRRRAGSGGGHRAGAMESARGVWKRGRRPRLCLPAGPVGGRSKEHAYGGWPGVRRPMGGPKGAAPA